MECRHGQRPMGVCRAARAPRPASQCQKSAATEGSGKNSKCRLLLKTYKKEMALDP